MSYPIYNTEKLVQFFVKELNQTNITPIGDNQFILIDFQNYDGYYIVDVLLEYYQKYNFNLLQQRITDINDGKQQTYKFTKFNGKSFSQKEQLELILKPQYKVEIIVKCRPEYLQIIKNIRLKIIKDI